MMWVLRVQQQRTRRTTVCLPPGDAGKFPSVIPLFPWSDVFLSNRLDGAAKVSYFLVLVLLRRLSQLVLP